MLKSLICTLLVMTSLNVFARGGDYKGNGGNVIFCPHKAHPYEVSDLYEARVAHGLTVDFAPGKNYLEIVKNMLIRIERLNPSRAELYRSFLDTFETESRLMPDAKLEVLPGDQGWAAIEEGCTLLQAIVQFKNPNIKGYRYFIDENLWNKLDEQNKAAITLHELIYREGLFEENSLENSLGVRYFNGVLHSNLMPTLSLQKYIEVLQKVGLQAADAQGYPISLHTGRNTGNARSTLVAFWNENTIAGATMPAKFMLPTGNGDKISSRCVVNPEKEREHEIAFYQNGSVKRVEMNCLAPVRVNLQGPGSSGNVMADKMEIDEEGHITHIVTNPRDMVWEDAMNYYSDSFYVKRELSKSAGPLDVFLQDGVPIMVCMYQDKNAKAASWNLLSNGTKQSFAASLKNAIAFSYDNKTAYEYDYSSCNQTVH